MNADEFDVLAGRIEGLARMVLHLVARLEDGDVIDGPAMAEGLRHSIVLKPEAGALMVTAQRTLENAADTLDEARRWRKFRQQAMTPPKHPHARRKAA
ncbi:MAG: hypothetical protein Q7U97_05800 [Rhodocyclaceae bacterium]|nr:hypothetical protein [Rhodocyclaceae bacterium]